MMAFETKALLLLLLVGILLAQTGETLEDFFLWTRPDLTQAQVDGFYSCIDTITKATRDPNHWDIVVRCWTYNTQ